MSREELHIRLLGPLEVFDDAGSVDLPPSKKARALLGYLVATGRPHGRSALCDLLWDEVDDPRAGLRWALSKLRGVVDRGGRRRIVASRDRVEFAVDEAVVDLHGVRSAVSDNSAEAPLELLEEVTRTFRGEFLEGLDLPGLHEYQTWCLGMRERMRRHHLTIRMHLTERLRGDPDKALPHALTRLRLDPFSEEAYIAAMDVLGDLGRVDQGLELYERCRRMLSQDLGAVPSPELRTARRRLRHRSGAARSRPDPEVGRTHGQGSEDETRVDLQGTTRALAELPAPEGLPEPGPDDPPLVGRSEEMELLLRIVRAAGSREAEEVVLVTGEPGIGKTRLLRELVRHVRSMEGWVVWGPIFETEEIRPYGPWIDLIRSLPAPALGEDLEGDLDSLLLDPGAVSRGDGPDERAQLFDAVARLLRRLAKARAPGLVALDDVQWLDASSAALLHYVARTSDTLPIVFVLAARSEEIEAGSVQGRLLRSLDEEDRLRRIPLQRLNASETGSLVQAVDTGADAGRIFATSEGNPLFALAMAGSLRDGTNRTPSSIEEELADRLARLDPRARSLLPWAAALGRAFDVPALVRVVDRPAPEIVDAIDELERRGILRATGPDRYDFSHSLLRQAAYQRLSEPGRRTIHRSIAQALDTADGPEGRAPASVAHHAALGGLCGLAARAYTEAAEHALWLFAFDEAAELVVRGLSQVESLADRERIPLEMGLLRLYGFRSLRHQRPEDVEVRVRRVTEEARRSGLTEVVAIGHAIRMELAYQRGSFKEAARSSVRSAEAGRESEPLVATRALAETAACLLLLDQAPEDARRLASDAVALAEEHGLEMDVVPLAKALLHHHDGDLEDASRAFQEVIRLGRRARDRWWECPALTRMITVELDRGEPERALSLAHEAEELAERLGDETESAFARGLGIVAAEMAREGESEGGEPIGWEALDEALRELRLLDSLWAIAHVQAYAAEVELERGRPGPARERAQEVLQAARILERPSLLALARSLLARSAALGGSPREGARHLDSSEMSGSHRRISHRARRAVRRARELVAIGSA